MLKKPLIPKRDEAPELHKLLRMRPGAQVNFLDSQGGWQLKYSYENGYGASVVCHAFSYGGQEGLVELAVLHNGALCYSTEITDDVVGWLPADKAADLLDRIKDLPVSEA